MMTDMIFSSIGQIVLAGGGGALIAYCVFQFLGKSWIQNQLAKDLELAKSEISLLAARRMKLHDREYLVFPEIWSKLNVAVSSLGEAMRHFRHLPDFARMTDDEFEKWMNDQNLADDEKDYLRREPDRTRSYNRISQRRSLMTANKDFVEFCNFFNSNRIFLSPDIKKKLECIETVISELSAAKQLEWEGFGPDEGNGLLRSANQTLEKKVRPIMREIEVLFQAKLFPKKGTPS
jgi:hypothetical protein